MNKNLCIFIWFFVGILIFSLIRSHCNCDITEGYCCEPNPKCGLIESKSHEICQQMKTSADCNNYYFKSDDKYYNCKWTEDRYLGTGEECTGEIQAFYQCDPPEDRPEPGPDQGCSLNSTHGIYIGSAELRWKTYQNYISWLNCTDTTTGDCDNVFEIGDGTNDPCVKMNSINTDNASCSNYMFSLKGSDTDTEKRYISCTTQSDTDTDKCTGYYPGIYYFNASHAICDKGCCTHPVSDADSPATSECTTLDECNQKNSDGKSGRWISNPSCAKDAKDMCKPSNECTMNTLPGKPNNPIFINGCINLPVPES